MGTLISLQDDLAFHERLLKFVSMLRIFAG